ncbi:hypothetical protein LSH36_1127g00056 [Paralvinella palmiformis]|uniref:Armadillo repeat-containing protein 8 n=1 Tax=Paralvinella palmiformis TaxID=53620 RepID=A0AAD9IVF2_9ANNE|nr:hypothetical protein LSH36_1127g00056 [Paralvinella palmiformis]
MTSEMVIAVDLGIIGLQIFENQSKIQPTIRNSALAMVDEEVDDQNLLEQLFQQESDRWMPCVKYVKNMVIGNNKQKNHVMNMGIVPRLLEFMINESNEVELRIESAVVLGSLAKGTEDNIRGLIEAGAVSVLLKDISHSNLKYVEACLRCLRTIFGNPIAPFDAIYQSTDHQVILCSNGAIAALAPLLSSNIYRVQMPTLKCFAQLCHQNQQVALAVATATYNGELIPNLLLHLLARDKTTEMQMQAAKCLTYLCRAGALDPADPLISKKTLQTLIRMCKQDKTWEERVEGAETLAYLIEVDINLQRISAISDHIINTLTDYFKYPGSPLDSTLMPTKKDDIVVGNELRQAAFRAYASLGANDEDIRKKIIETENLMEHTVNGLSDPVTKVQMAAVRCLHSLSRSVQQLRTSFQDHTVWKPLMKVLHSGHEEVLAVASSTLCNLLLEFSPSKEPILGSGAVELLADLTKQEDSALRLNGIWGLMNMAFQAEQKVKSQILNALGPEHLFRLLSDPDVNILMKTLGLLRNLLSTKPHIDQIMMIHGTQVMQAVILILEGDHPVEVKEQALCILANVADGDSAKNFIMGNEDVLKKIMNYMIHSNVKLQIAATFCVSNLLWNEQEGDSSGAIERQKKLRELGVQKLLQQLLSTNDTTLFDKVKTALQQF